MMPHVAQPFFVTIFCATFLGREGQKIACTMDVNAAFVFPRYVLFFWALLLSRAASHAKRLAVLQL